MKRANAKRKSVNFRNGVRGKYAGMKLVIVGASSKKRSSKAKKTAENVLEQVSRVLDSAGSTKREMETAINHARELIDSAS
jgi:hypothetical protein